MLYLKFSNVKVKLDISWFENNHSENADSGYELEKVFNVRGKYNTLIIKRALIMRMIRKLLLVEFKYVNECEGFLYDSNVGNAKDNNEYVFLSGYWQNEEYFKNIKKN